MNAVEFPAWLPIWWFESIWLVIAVFFVASLTEMIFPPFPGDTVYFLGLVAVQAAGSSVVAALVSTLFGAALGFAILYWLGKSRGRQLFRAEKTGMFSLTSLKRVEGWFARWGKLTILLGRFASGVRSAIPIAAGIGSYPVASTAALAIGSIVLWNGLLAALALALHQNWTTVSHYWNAYSVIFWVTGGVLLSIMVLRVWLRRRTR